MSLQVTHFNQSAYLVFEAESLVKYANYIFARDFIDGEPLSADWVEPLDTVCVESYS